VSLAGPRLEKVVVVTRKTRMQELVGRYNTPGQAKFHIRAQLENDLVARKHVPLQKARSMALGAADEYEKEDDAYQPVVRDLVRRLSELDVEVHPIDRTLVPTYLFTEHDIVLTLGQDGLVANCAKYAGSQPIVGVNPDPARFDGVLLPFRADDAVGAVESLLRGRARTREATLAEAVLNDGQRLLAFNDLFIGAKTHVSARYQIRWADRSENQSSSGVIVSTGAGSTGWLSSTFNMAAGLEAGGGGTVARPSLRWEDRELFFVVREPFISRMSAAGVVAGRVGEDASLEIESQMSEGGVIFSDGVESDYLEFNSGALAAIRPAAQRARLVVPS
jgi:NAD kinase